MRKQNNEIKVRLGDQDHARLKKQAEDNGTTMTTLIRQYVKDALDRGGRIGVIDRREMAGSGGRR